MRVSARALHSNRSTPPRTRNVTTWRSAVTEADSHVRLPQSQTTAMLPPVSLYVWIVGYSTRSSQTKESQRGGRDDEVSLRGWTTSAHVGVADERPRVKTVRAIFISGLSVLVVGVKCKKRRRDRGEVLMRMHCGRDPSSAKRLACRAHVRGPPSFGFDWDCWIDLWIDLWIHENESSDSCVSSVKT